MQPSFAEFMIWAQDTAQAILSEPPNPKKLASFFVDVQRALDSALATEWPEHVRHTGDALGMGGRWADYAKSPSAPAIALDDARLLQQIIMAIFRYTVRSRDTIARKLIYGALHKLCDAAQFVPGLHPLECRQWIAEFHDVSNSQIATVGAMRSRVMPAMRSRYVPVSPQVWQPPV